MAITTKLSDLIFGTPIHDIEVPEHLNRTVKTGIDYVDSAMGGLGFTPSSVTLFTGEPGSGKTTLVLIIAAALAKKKDTIAIFNTAEESLYQVKLVVERLKLRNGFAVGQETHVPTLLEKCDKLRKKNPKAPFFLIVDSLQCMDDGFYKDGHTNSRSSERALGQITDWCKENYVNAVVIGQVSKSGQASGSNKLKHMVDAMMHLGVERKDADLEGCRVLQTTKNRFGGCGHTFFLALDGKGFTEVARVSAA